MKIKTAWHVNGQMDNETTGKVQNQILERDNEVTYHLVKDKRQKDKSAAEN